MKRFAIGFLDNKSVKLCISDCFTEHRSEEEAFLLIDAQLVINIMLLFGQLDQRNISYLGRQTRANERLLLDIVSTNQRGDSFQQTSNGDPISKEYAFYLAARRGRLPGSTVRMALAVTDNFRNID